MAWLRTLSQLAIVFILRLLRDYITFLAQDFVDAAYYRIPNPNSYHIAWTGATRPGLLLSEALYAPSSYFLQFLLDRAFPVRPEVHPIDEKEAEVMQRLIAAGRVQRRGITWVNVLIKWLLEYLLFTAIMGILTAMIAGRPFSFHNTIPAIFHVFGRTWEPFTSVLGYILVPAEYRVQFRDIMEIMLSVVHKGLLWSAIQYEDQPRNEL